MTSSVQLQRPLLQLSSEQLFTILQHFFALQTLVFYQPVVAVDDR